MRIAILGGSFDPIHKGHLQIAKTALKNLPIDELWFMPAHVTPLKAGQSASFDARVEMIRRAIHPYRHMKLCLLEREWEGTSYTIRSVMTLQRRYPQHSFCWLIGDDQALHFDAWKDSETLKQKLPFYVFSRFQEEVEVPYGFHRVVMDYVDISSSQIRMGQGLEMVPSVVLDVIGEQGLYVKEIMRAHMSEKRYQHSCSVAKLCQELAQVHHLDAHKAYLMGLLHDCCKEMPKQQAQIWMRHHMPDKLSQAPAIWHGYIGADWVRRTLHIYDKDIGEAIYHHVLGRGRSDYDRILYVSDKLDPLRGYDIRRELALCKQDLKRGYQLVKQQQVAYLSESGI